jgi:hypothetical protein
MHKPDLGLNEACQADLESGSESEKEDFYEHCVARPNMVDCGIQTSKIHFKKVAKTSDFQQEQQSKALSTDWSYSALYEDAVFKKAPV